jgi:ABC-type polysaccharide/polyol phosphate export permease
MIEQYVVNDRHVSSGARSTFADIRRSGELFIALVERQLRARAKRTWMGVIWPVVSPAFLLFLYVFVFQSVFKVPIEHYSWYLFAALLPWTFLVQALGVGLTCLATEPELIRRAPFPYELIPLSNVAVMALYFLTSLVVFIGFLGLFGHMAWAVLPAIVLPVIAVLLLVSALTLLLSLLDVYNRDLRQLLNNLLTIWFFLVPIVYRPNMTPSKLKVLRSIDPMNLTIGQFRDVLYYGRLSHLDHMAVMLVVSVAAFAISLTVFRRLAVNLPKDV